MPLNSKNQLELSREDLINALLDRLGQVLKEKGITLEHFIANGREIRGEIYKDKYRNTI